MADIPSAILTISNVWQQFLAVFGRVLAKHRDAGGSLRRSAAPGVSGTVPMGYHDGPGRAPDQPLPKNGQQLQAENGPP
jgi:hypothetical protein